MAKTLQRPSPTSSVANLLDPIIGARAVAHSSIASVQTPSQHLIRTGQIQLQDAPYRAQPTGEVPDIPRQFTLTATTDRTLKRVIDTIAEATGMELRHSELLRAMLCCAAEALPALHEEARKIGPLRRPKNERGREAQREAVERRIAHAFAAAIRARALRE